MPKLSSNKPKIVITIGDSAGIGPEIVVKSLAKKEVSNLANFIIVGSKAVMERAKRSFKSKIAWKETLSQAGFDFSDWPILLLDLKNISPQDFSPGRVSSVCGKAALEYLDAAVELLRSGQGDLLVTAPLSKEAVALVKKDFIGHSEYLAQKTNSKQIAMFFVSDRLKVALVTRHIPLREVPVNLNPENIYQVIDLVVSALRKYFGLANPKLAVCGLNPHAGEAGLFGKEEKEIIEPAILKAKKRQLLVFGPLPADTVFRLGLEKKFDAVVALYHDQGLIPFKMLFQDVGVNVTLGLPFIRTSPDHGTAFDIAWKNLASPEAFISAIKTALKMWRKAKKKE